MKPARSIPDLKENGQHAPGPERCNSVEKVAQPEASSTNRKQNYGRRRVINEAAKDYRSPRKLARVLSQNSKKLTICLSLWLAAASILSPIMMNLHLTREVGLFLMEAEILELRLSIFNVIGSGLVLIVVNLILWALAYSGLSSRSRRLQSKWTQSLLRPLISLFALASAISYLAMALTVSPVKQVTRVPYATFDCNANSIIIENCHQQFTSRPRLSGTSSLDQATGYLDPVHNMLVGDLYGQQDNERLIKKLDCLKYGGQQERPPTRFLLHHCGLVCKPNRQQVTQFSDDLNRDQLTSIDTNSYSDQAHIAYDSENAYVDRQVHLEPPYSSNISSSYGQNRLSGSRDNREEQTSTRNEVSLKVCFSDEFQQGSSYQQFCITNLANNNKQTSSISYHNNQLQNRALTVSQLNRVLRKMTPKSDDRLSANQDEMLVDLSRTSPKASDEHHHQVRGAQDDQATSYVNPVVQFESHFRYNQQASNSSTGVYQDPNASWCNLRPIPPFIVDNKPFSDIQCSIEHQYVMSTKTISARNKILFEKSSLATGAQSYESVNSSPSERCNIQCKVNILYQVYKNQEASQPTPMPNAPAANDRTSQGHRLISDLHYYMPLKQCLVVANESEKQSSVSQYQFYRTIGNTTSFLIFVLLDLLVMLESMDRRRAHFEGNKYRLIGLLIVLFVVPLVNSVIFDLISSWSQRIQFSSAANPANISTLAYNVNPTFAPSSQYSQTSVYISSFLRENLLVYLTKQEPPLVADRSRTSQETMGPTRSSKLANDRYIVPFLAYAVAMFVLAYCAFTLTPVGTSGPLIRSTSVEELGIGSLHLTDSGETDAQTKQQLEKMADTKASNVTPMEFVKLVLLALLLGMQFNLTFLSGQLQILVESLGNPADAISVGQSQFKLTKFMFETYSGTILVVLAGALIFSEEIVSFTSSFSIFNSTTKQSIGAKIEVSMTKEANSLELSRQVQFDRRIELNFYRYIIVSLAMYALRGYLMANLNPSLTLKRLTVFLYHLIELINLPITWLVLTYRSHWLISRLSVARHDKQANQVTATARPSISDRERRGNYVFESHILMQSMMAIIYFAVSKFLTLLLHSQFANAYLHSDNVDWFITAFYDPVPSASRNSGDGSGANSRNKTLGADIRSNTNSNQPETLFSPLPSEKQTYLHASKQFIKYNSLFCLAFIAILLVNVAHLTYKLWLGRQREDELLRLMKQQLKGKVSSIDERLGLDLMRLHMSLSSSSSPQTAEATSNVDISADDESNGDSESRRQPRAKVLFHYNVTQCPAAKTASSSSSSISSSSSPRDKSNHTSHPLRAEPTNNVTEDTSKCNEQTPSPLEEDTDYVHNARSEVRIPIHLEQDPGSYVKRDSDHPMISPTISSNSDPSTVRGVVERTTTRQFKRISLVEDDENWQDVGNSREDLESASAHAARNKFIPASKTDKEEVGRNLAVNSVDMTPDSTVKSQRRRTITFAAQPILIDPNDESSRSSEMQTNSIYSFGPCKHASPEPSICLDDED